MHDATDHELTADDIVAAVTRLQDDCDALRIEVDDLMIERDELRRQIEQLTRDVLVTCIMRDIPGGRGWSYVEDAQVLALSPDLDSATEARLLSQVVRPDLVACDGCGAPHRSNAPCGIHGAA
ncbi:hypothetical protein [Trujillonella endophytica]|uniref:Uncharacterized protein n=1 Tax=Trujillonella endophytica TaxID=673521 RepID=A0A1H8UIC8_9ACTN|nr:hypothetical protein [Trujillella endophytica]SEP02911.1 hypothetical protein SAMN05660991_02941 [Trujillella endophytica]